MWVGFFFSLTGCTELQLLVEHLAVMPKDEVISGVA